MAQMTITSFMTGIKNWVLGKIGAITDLIPLQASSSNKLADKAFVNSSIATATATFQGTYNVVSDLSLSYNATHAQIQTALGSAISTADNNDYAFVQIPTADATPTQIAKTEKYKYNGTAWAFEYELNSSGFTAAQWAAINSGATLELIGKLSALPTNAQLIALLDNKVSWTDNGAYDVTAHNSGATFASLSALLNSENLDTLIPIDIRRGGMSIKYVQSSDNKYVQYRLMSNTFNTTPANWQKLGAEVSVSQNTLTIGNTPTDITSSYIININHFVGQPYTAFESKNAARISITSNSMVRKSGGVYAFLLADGWYVEQYISTSLIDDAWLLEKNWNNICHNLDGKIVFISGMGTFGNITGITEKGQYYYNTSSKQLSVCISISSPMSGANFAQIPLSTKALYKYDDLFYNWNGTDLIPIIPAIDSTPTTGSNNLVRSGGVKDALDYQKSIFEGAANVLPQNADKLFISDVFGNVLAKFDKNGLETIAYFMRTARAIESGKKGLKVCDAQGNIIFRLDDYFGFGDNVKDFVAGVYNKPAVCWIDDDFQIMDGDEVSAEYTALHDWCITNNIRMDFAFIPNPYVSANRLTIAQQWLRESFHFLLHPFHDGWFDNYGNTYDLSKVRSSLVDCIKYFREHFFVTGDNIIVYPGSSYTFPDIVKLVKQYTECAIQADYNETNHIVNNNRYRLKRYSITFDSVKTKTRVKQDLANFIANGDWVILETHIYNYHNDLTTLDETTNSLANVLDVVGYLNGLCPLRPTCEIWKERRFMFDMFNN